MRGTFPGEAGSPGTTLAFPRLRMNQRRFNSRFLHCVRRSAHSGRNDRAIFCLELPAQDKMRPSGVKQTKKGRPEEENMKTFIGLVAVCVLFSLSSFAQHGAGHGGGDGVGGGAAHMPAHGPS